MSTATDDLVRISQQTFRLMREAAGKHGYELSSTQGDAPAHVPCTKWLAATKDVTCAVIEGLERLRDDDANSRLDKG